MQQVLGISKQELHADPLLWHNSIHPEDLPRVDGAIARARHGRPVDVEYRIQGRDGQWRWLHDRAEVFRDASGQVHLAGVAVNITTAKLTAEALEQSRKMFQAVAEDLPALVCRYAPGCIITYVNEAYCRYFGKTRAELEGTSFLDLMPKPAQESFQVNLGRMTPKQPTVQTEHQVFGPNGETRWQRWTDRAIFDAQGRISVYQSIGEDITATRMAQEALERLSREYEVILNTTHSSIFLLGVDDQERLVFERLNPREEELTGLTTEAVRGKTPVEALGEELGRKVERNYRHCLERKQVISYEETLPLPGGERTWLTQLAPVLEGGRVVRIVGSGLDITDRKRAEEKVRAGETRLRLVADGTADWEYWILPDGGLEYCSPSCERITGYTVAEFSTDPGLLQRIVHPEDVQAWSDHAHFAARNREPRRITFRIISRTGQEVWIEHHCVALIDEEGRYRGRRASNRDVTGWVEAEQELRRENERLRREIERLRQENERLRQLPG